MSPHDLHLILSEAAKSDIVDILQYTYDEWGDVQVDAYSAVIDRALSNICEYPNLGAKMPEISDRHMAMKAGQHIIIYTAMGDSAYIARILHSRMDIKNRF